MHVTTSLVSVWPFVGEVDLIDWDKMCVHNEILDLAVMLVRDPQKVLDGKYGRTKIILKSENVSLAINMYTVPSQFK